MQSCHYQPRRRADPWPALAISPDPCIPSPRLLNPRFSPRPPSLRQVAEAPKVRTNKVQGMEELEEEAHYKLPAMDDRDIDLSLLTAVLCSSEQVGGGSGRGVNWGLGSGGGRAADR